MGRDELTLTVHGNPAPQGSKKAVGSRISKRGNRVPILIESSAGVKPWREQVAIEARKWTREHPGWSPLEGPLIVDLHFTVAAPLRIPKERHGYPCVPPDRDKLERAVNDALTGIIWRDDGQIVDGRTTKSYPNCGPLSLDKPGVRIVVRRME